MKDAFSHYNTRIFFRRFERTPASREKFVQKAAIRLSRRSLGIERRGPKKPVRQNLCSILTQGFDARRKSSAEL